MRDGIIKADGTSRLLRADLPATYEELRTKAAAGEQPLDMLFNSAGWSQQPTFLNKANLLQDTTAALFGLGSGAVPDEAFAEVGKYNEYWWKRITPAGSTEYVHSTDRNAYPDSGTVDGYTYTYLGVPFENAVTASKIEIGSYVGTGTYGSSNPNSLTFGFVPKAVFILWTRLATDDTFSSLTSYVCSHLMPFTYETDWIYINGKTAAFKISEDRKTVSWFHTSSGNYQLNVNLNRYYYIAIG